jgi:hypothetical protein
MSEQWKDVVGFPGYEISDQGQVLSRRGRHRPPTLLKPLETSVGGYRYVRLYDLDGGSSNVRVHRLVLEAFIGPAPEGMEGRHLNGDPADNRLTNLCWGTPLENADDKRAHGTVSSQTGHAGEEHRAAKLTEEIVITIRARHASGDPQKFLADEFGVAPCTVSQIVNRRTWQHI